MPVTEAESWTVLDDGGSVLDPVESYLSYLAALERSPNTQRAYATSLKLWFEYLASVEVEWAEVSVDDVGRFVAWMRAPAPAVRRTVAVIEEFARTGTDVSIAVVAHTAGVSRSWLYEQPDLLADIHRLRERTSVVRIPAAQRASDASHRQRLDAARAEIERLQAENAVLRERVARTLGEHRLHR